MSETTCRYVGPSSPRLLNGRHGENCPEGGCPGCQPCPDRHCAVCYREHADEQTCPSCISRTRGDLNAIVELFALLPEQAAEQPRDSPAGATRLNVMGGDAMVMLAPHSAGSQSADKDLESAGDPTPPLLVLATWEDDWRGSFGHDAGPLATIDGTVDYLERNLARAAREHMAFDEFASEVRSVKYRLEAVTGDADPTIVGVSCFDCGGDLRQEFTDPDPCDHGHAPCGCDQGGRRDDWKCARCSRAYTDHDYRRAVRQAHAEQDPLRTAPQIAAMHGIDASTLRTWANRGHIKRHKRGTKTHYDVREVRKRAMLGGLLADEGVV